MNASAALAAPGVIAVLTYQDINDIPPPPPLPEGGPPPGSEAAPLPMGGVWQEPLLAVDRVRFVGEPVAMVLTDDSYQGEDAAELVSVDYEPLPAIVDPADALAGHTLLFPDAGSNVAVAHPAGDTAFEGCDVVVSRDIVNQRVAPVPMEGRAAAAMWVDGKLTVWVSTQNAQISRFIMAGAFGLDPDAIRVVAPDVGGGFGAKVGIDRDAILVAWAARHTGRALRWVELAARPGRDVARRDQRRPHREDRRNEGQARPGLPARRAAGHRPTRGSVALPPRRPGRCRPLRHRPRRGSVPRWWSRTTPSPTSGRRGDRDGGGDRPVAESASTPAEGAAQETFVRPDDPYQDPVRAHWSSGD